MSAEQVLSAGLIPVVGVGKDMGKGCRRVNMVQILCIHICKLNETIQERERGDKGE
jgi:hypothetical protein